jgi:putative hydrolase of the HAD superfamily
MAFASSDHFVPFLGGEAFIINEISCWRVIRRATRPYMAVRKGEPASHRLEPGEAQAHLADPTLVACEVQSSSHEDRKVRNSVIKGVTIDLWGTLLLDSPAADERYRRERLVRIAEVLAERGIEVPIPALARGYEESRRQLVKIWREMRDVPVERHAAILLHAVDAALPERLDADGLAAVTWAYASPALEAPPLLDPGAASALKALNERGIAVCLVSNTMRTPGTVLRRILKNEGLLDAFTSMVFSDECGMRKPASGIFHEALKRLGVGPHHAVHVGDDVRLDVEGARLANMRVIHLGGGHACADMPDASIQGLSELPAAVDWLENASEPRDATPVFLAGPAVRR